jgi:multicomponent Na+:H+ antiporter subunit E
MLFATWLLWSGIYTPLVIGFGVVSSVAVSLIFERMRDPQATRTPLTTILRMVAYVPWLMLEIVKSNLHVARVILLSPGEVRPRLVRVKCHQDTDFGQVLYANSITLTPGTISLDVRNQHILVHALTKYTAEGLFEGTMDRKCTWVEKGT